MAGITAFGGYVPRLRLERSAIARHHAWADPGILARGKGTRSICNWDEDAVTMGVEAARDCLADRDDTSPVPDAVYFASTSFPFADRQNAGILATALGLAGDRVSLDITGSQRAGTSALLQALGAVAGGMLSEALVVAADKRRTRASAAGEFAYGDGAAALTVSADDGIARFLGAHTVTEDFVDHFRAAGEEFDYTWEERWIRDEGLAKIVPPAITRALDKAGVAADEVAHFCMPSTIGRAVDGIAKTAGIPATAVRDNLHAELGECGAAHALVMLLHTLQGEVAAGDRIVVAAFGQGVDVLVFEATAALAALPARQGIRGHLAAGKATDNYPMYLAFNDLIALDKGMRAERDDYKTALTVTWRKRDMLLGLVGGRCTQCGTLQFPRADICVNPQCRAHHTQEPHPFRDEAASVLTWSADYLTYIPNPPSHYGMITFANGGRFMTDFTDVDVGELDVGMQVRMMFRIKSTDSLRGFVRYFWKAVPVRTAESADNERDAA
ncbi:MAG TPA: 3-oxoacyl-[acyl-carrier-protein] synthase III C-terminal domain-containing protein [Pseudomonadales bacterium]|nr:3-oxoacyl-[acyl-carrier-protein] synthase III C-terminal domain-containing protein [Pseudomonadales bacterium]